MRRILVSAVALSASLFTAGWMAATSAEEGKTGPALPPPSLFDVPSNQVRAIDSQSPASASTVVTAKPAPASVMAEADLPPPEQVERRRTRKSVWWKPWTWFSGSGSTSARTDTPAAPVAMPKQGGDVNAAVPKDSGSTKSAGNAAGKVDGYAFDAPSKIIRSGMGTCLKTGMWQSSGSSSGHCGDTMASNDAKPGAEMKAKEAGSAEVAASKAGAQAEPMPRPSQKPSAAETMPKHTPSAHATSEPAEPPVVSAFVPEKEIQSRPLAESDQFESVRVSPTPGPAESMAPSAASTRSSEHAEVSKKSATGASASASAHADAKRAGGAGKPVTLEADKPFSMSAEALFGFKSAVLLPGGKKQLDQVAAKLADGDYQTIRVVGHTDRVGAPSRNKKLSLRRAEAVKEYLVQKGVESRRIVTNGRGAESPITEPQQCTGLSVTARRSCMAPDRRVEITVVRALARKKPEAHPAANGDGS